MFWFLLLAASTVLAFWIEWRIRKRSLFANASKVPGPPTVPLLGNALKFMVPSERFFNVITDMKEEYGHIFKFWLGPDLNYFVSDPDVAKIILTSSKTSVRGPAYKYMVDMLGYGIFSGSGPIWRNRRKIISPNYSSKTTESYNQVFNQEANCLLDRLRAKPCGTLFNIYDEVVKTTSYASCRTLFGLTREQTLNLPYLQTIIEVTHRLYLDVFQRMTTWYLQIQPLYWVSPQYSRHKKCLKYVLAMSDTIVQHRLKLLETMKKEKEMNLDQHNSNEFDKNPGFSIVDKLIITKSVPEYEELLKQTFTIFTSSQEPPANVASTILLMMALHSECQDKLYAEIQHVLGDSDRDVTDGDIKQMPYLDMVFKEVLRVFPIGSILQRSVMEDIDINSDMTLPKGSSVTILVYHMHRDKKYWVNPDVFDPERFSEENSKLRHPHCFIPFSLGSMDCIGRHFGARLVKTLVIRVLQEYRLTSPETYEDLKLVCAVSVHALNGYPVYLHPRNT